MSRLIDLTGKRFKQLVVIERTEDNVLPSGLKEPMWLCACDCGNESIVRGAFLRSGHTGTCGCGQTGHNFIDIQNFRFGRVLVVERVASEKGVGSGPIPRWRCLCDCGTEFVTRGSSLKSGHTKSCGCRKKQLRIKDMIGRQFGKLVVVSRGPDELLDSGLRYVTWNCECECGSTMTTRGTALRSGHTISCGCARFNTAISTSYMPKSEMWVQHYLDDLGFDYTMQKTYPNLRGVGYGLLSYDFLVHTDNITCLIECHGLQHYEPVEYFGGAVSFEIQQEHDARKRAYAKRHNIPLIEIPVHGLKESDIRALLDDVII